MCWRLRTARVAVLAIVAATFVALCPTPTFAQGFHKEIRKDDRVYVFTNASHAGIAKPENDVGPRGTFYWTW